MARRKPLLPVQIVLGLLAVIWGAVGLFWHVVGPYWEKKLTTEARRKELKAEKEKEPPKTPKRYLFAFGVHVVLVGVPSLFVADGLLSWFGVLYSPRLSFFSPFNLYLQALGFILSGLGLVLMYGVGTILQEQVYGRALEERKMMYTGIYAYVRHPFYVHFIILPVGLVLLTLNHLAVLLVLAYAQPWSFMREIRKEEEELLKRFGKAYEEYMKKTERFLPKIRR